MKRLLMEKGLVIATHNPGKLKEIQALVQPLGISCSSASDHGLPEPEETGTTFIENAMLKARAAYSATTLPSMADDSGLVIPALDGQPGIYSARWAEKNGKRDFNIAFERIWREITETDAPLSPNCYFVCVLSVALPKQESIEINNSDAEEFSLSIAEENDTTFYNIEGRVYGTLTFPPRGDNGFGYDPIFTPNGETETFGEMEPEKKHRMSHRAHAFDGFLKLIQ